MALLEACTLPVTNDTSECIYVPGQILMDLTMCELSDSPYRHSHRFALVPQSVFQNSVFPSFTELLAASASAVDLDVEEAKSLGWKASEAELMQ